MLSRHGESREIGTVVVMATIIALLYLAGVIALMNDARDMASYEMIEAVVAPGDTLWSLAVDHAPERDPREVVHDIRTANGGIDPGALRPGDVVLVPSTEQ